MSAETDAAKRFLADAEAAYEAMRRGKPGDETAKSAVEYRAAVEAIGLRAATILVSGDTQGEAYRMATVALAGHYALRDQAARRASRRIP